jgi:hypothetical protein
MSYFSADDRTEFFISISQISQKPLMEKLYYKPEREKGK